MRRYLSRIEDRLQAGGRHRAAAHRALRRRPDERVGRLRAARPYGAVRPGRRRHQHHDAVAPLGLPEAAGLRHGRHLHRRIGDHRRRGRRSRARPRSACFPAKVPTLDVRSVGAGGGSIADVSELTGSLRVGPRSAGAQPGPGLLWPRRHGTDGERRQCRARLSAAAAARRRHERSTSKPPARPSPASASRSACRPRMRPRASSTSPTR